LRLVTSTLSDEVRALARVLGELLEEAAGAGARDGAEVLVELLLVHADAVVLDDQGLVGPVQGDADGGIEGDALVGLVRDREVAELVDGVGGIGDELAEEYLLVRVERVDDEVEEARNLRLEVVLRHTVLPGAAPAAQC
jgi:hypothetical protein